MKVVGLAVVFDGDIESQGYRGDFTPILYATFDGKHETVYTDLEFIPRLSRCEQKSLADFDPNGVFVAHNLPKDFIGDNTTDLLRLTQTASAEVLQNEGKRYALADLCRWNKVRGFHQEIATAIKKYTAYRKGDHHKIARWSLEEAKRCQELFVVVRKRGRIRFVDANTGKLAFAELDFTEEE